MEAWFPNGIFLAVSDRVVSLLNDGDTEMQYVAIGVLVNLLADPDGRPALRNVGIISK